MRTAKGYEINPLRTFLQGAGRPHNPATQSTRLSNSVISMPCQISEKQESSTCSVSSIPQPRGSSITAMFPFKTPLSTSPTDRYAAITILNESAKAPPPAKPSATQAVIFPLRSSTRGHHGIPKPFRSHIHLFQTPHILIHPPVQTNPRIMTPSNGKSVSPRSLYIFTYPKTPALNSLSSSKNPENHDFTER